MRHAVAKKRFTADEYQRMGQVGILSEDDRVELIDGEVLAMKPTDLVLLRPRADFYASRLAGRGDILLLIVEVADASIEYDRDRKGFTRNRRFLNTGWPT